MSMNETLVQLDDGATMPAKAHRDDVGYDLQARSIKFIGPDGNPADLSAEIVSRIEVDTGVHVRPPKGYHFELMANSRLAKSGLCIPNGLGLIDPGYTGAVRIILTPINSMRLLTARKVMDNMGSCGQLVLRKTHATQFVQVSELPETERGAGGFGSTRKGGKA